MNDDELDDIVEQVELMMDKGKIDTNEPSEIIQDESLSPTQPLLLSQHAEVLKNKPSVEKTILLQSPPAPSQSIDEILGEVEKHSQKNNNVSKN